MMRSRTNILKFLLATHGMFLLAAFVLPDAPMIEVLHVGVISINGPAFAIYLPILATFIAKDDIREEDVIPFCILFMTGGITMNSMWSLGARFWAPINRPNHDFISFFLFWCILGGFFSLAATKIDHGRLPKLEAYFLARRIGAVLILVILAMFTLRWHFTGAFF